MKLSRDKLRAPRKRQSRLLPFPSGLTRMFVMAGLGPAIHVLTTVKTWMPGTSPGMTDADPVEITGEAHTVRPENDFAAGKSTTISPWRSRTPQQPGDTQWLA